MRRLRDERSSLILPEHRGLRFDEREDELERGLGGRVVGDLEVLEVSFGRTGDVEDVREEGGEVRKEGRGVERREGDEVLEGGGEIF